MDLVADMLLQHLPCASDQLNATMLRPGFTARLTRLPLLGKHPTVRNADRLINRFYEYPRWISMQKSAFDLFHLVDHSYSQLVHQLPPDRVVVTCHDLETFRCLLSPDEESRWLPFRMMTQRILDGFRKAAHVVCVTEAIRDQVVKHSLIAPEKVSVVHNGIHPCFSAKSDLNADMEADHLLGERDRFTNILHVGSTVARKRIDVLLESFASLKETFPRVRLIQAGGAFTAQQEQTVERLGLRDAIVQLPFLSTPVLASIYRSAAFTVSTSDREGFCLPLVESMACGTPVVASNIPAIREVGGTAAVYCKPHDSGAFSQAFATLLGEKAENTGTWASRVSACTSQTMRFSWAEYARKLSAVYFGCREANLRLRRGHSSPT
jgi:glycosyltransferase involved in cell wall biosynthesis